FAIYPWTDRSTCQTHPATTGSGQRYCKKNGTLFLGEIYELIRNFDRACFLKSNQIGEFLISQRSTVRLHLFAAVDNANGHLVRGEPLGNGAKVGAFRPLSSINGMTILTGFGIKKSFSPFGRRIISFYN